MDRLTSMAVFVKAVDLGSFSAAADALELSGPMVGKHVRFLEERLGMPLITRTTRRQSLTEFGREYYDRCRVVLAEVDAADALAADHADKGEQSAPPRGRLRVTVPVHFGRRCVAPVLLALTRQYPGLELDLSFSDRFSDLIEDGFDLAIRTGEPDDKAGVVARRVARQIMIVCASPGNCHGRMRPERRCRSCPPIRCGWTISTPWLTPPRWASGWHGCRTGWSGTGFRRARWSTCCPSGPVFPTMPTHCGRTRPTRPTCHARCASPWRRWRPNCRA